MCIRDSRWAGLDDLLMHLARRLTDFTGLMSLITQPQQENQQLETIRLVPSGDRLLVMLVEANGRASHLNLRLPHGAEAELTAMERWASAQLEQGDLNWEALPRQLQRSGAVLRNALEQPTPANSTQVVVHGLSRLVSEQEFESTSRLRPLLEPVSYTHLTLPTKRIV